MTETGNKAILMSGHELLLFLYKREIEGLVLPKEIAELSADERQLKQAMGELVTDKYLLPGNDGIYQTSPYISGILDTMAGASNVYVIEEMNNKFEPCYIYRLNLEAVSLSIDAHHKDWVRLESVRIEDKLKELSEFPLTRIQIQRFKAGDDEPDKIIIVEGGSEEDLLDKLLEE